MNPKIESMDFAAEFVKYVDTHGIFDEFDADLNKMVTSSRMAALIKQAKALFPDMPTGKPAKMMRDLTDEERDQAIKVSETKVVDARRIFSRKMAENQGARGLLNMIVLTEDPEELVELLKTAKTFIEWESNNEEV